MIEKPHDALLMSGKTVARIFQVASAVAGGVVLLLIPVVVLVSQNMLPGFGGENGSGAIAASPLSVIAIFAMLASILAAMFAFFGRLRAIIVSAGEGDPFTPDNARRLTEMAWLFLAVKVLGLMIGALRAHVANLIDNGANRAGAIDLSLYDLDAIVIVIVLFILARIFRHGAAMREDLRGTV